MKSLLALFRCLPLYVPVVFAYAGLVMMNVDVTTNAAPIIPNFTLPSGASIDIKTSDVFLVVMVTLLILEIIKAARANQRYVIIDHSISTLVLIGLVVMLLNWQPAGNSTFLVMTATVFVDAFAGWIVALRTSMRDVNIAGGNGAAFYGDV